MVVSYNHYIEKGAGVVSNWRVWYDIVLLDSRDTVVERDLSEDVQAPNIINASEKVRRLVENGERRGEKGEKLSGFVTKAERL